MKSRLKPAAGDSGRRVNILERYSRGSRLLPAIVAMGALCSMAACDAGGSNGGAGTKGFYGSALNADDLANVTIGHAYNDNCNRLTSIRLRAKHSGLLQSMRLFFIWNYSRIGYHSGHGGIIQIQVQTDDGSADHFPSGVTLASLSVVHPVNDTIGYYPSLTFASPPRLTEGQLYHFVFTNVDPDPAQNWVSLDCAWMWYASTPMQPTLPDTDMAILERCPSGAWSLYKRGDGSVTPCIELDYADGASQGQGYIEFYFQNPKPISGPRGVRQTFTVSGSDRVVTSVSVRLRYVSGTGPLSIRVEQADGTLVDQGTVASVPVTPGNNGSSWAKVNFATPRTLRAGQSYYLVLSAPEGTVFQTHGIRQGADKGFKPTTLFADGYAQFNDGTGWTGWDMWGQTDRRDADLQFYFETR